MPFAWESPQGLRWESGGWNRSSCVPSSNASFGIPWTVRQDTRMGEGSLVLASEGSVYLGKLTQ